MPEHEHNGGELLKQPTRRRILEVIQRLPGIKITNVCRETGAGWGTVKHHLYLLERSGLVVSRPTGRDRLLFSAELDEEDLRVAEALNQGRAESLARAIMEMPGASQKELCARVRMTRKIIRHNVDLLTRAGLISERRESRYQRYYPSPLLVKHLDALRGLEGAPPPPPGGLGPGSFGGALR